MHKLFIQSTKVYSKYCYNVALHWCPQASTVKDMIFQSKQTEGIENNSCDILLDPLAKICTRDFEVMWSEMSPV